MYELVVEQHFEAAHFLRGYKGKCENLHGHRYSVVVRLKKAELNEIGLAFDFTEIKSLLKDIMARLDHACLNDIPPFDKINPSAENIAATIYNELKAKIVDPDVRIGAVEAWENPLQGAVYRPDE
jgi:6-pyruvoyltetrahydropterin/6-carboxytetrahydropterin synthase